MQLKSKQTDSLCHVNKYSSAILLAYGHTMHISLHGFSVMQHQLPDPNGGTVRNEKRENRRQNWKKTLDIILFNLLIGRLVSLRAGS